MPCAHATASGMGGMRAAGDLVARLQMTRGMRLAEAKETVASCLGVSPSDLSDPIQMNELRAELGLGRITTFEMSYPNDASAMEAKARIAELLNIPINSVRRFQERSGMAKATP